MKNNLKTFTRLVVCPFPIQLARHCSVEEASREPIESSTCWHNLFFGVQAAIVVESMQSQAIFYNPFFLISLKLRLLPGGVCETMASDFLCFHSSLLLRFNLRTCTGVHINMGYMNWVLLIGEW